MQPPVVFALGFRTFFLLASLWSALAVGGWVLILRGAWSPPLAGLGAVPWHAHEMVYGFARAVVAGFLLTAVRNWTGRPTLHGWGLAGLAALWTVPRLLLTFGPAEAHAAGAALDVAFGLGLAAAVARPIVATRQMKQAGIVAKVVLLTGGDLLVHLGHVGVIEHGVRWGLALGVYLLLALILTIARRVLPFFVGSALPGSGPFPDRVWLDRVLLALFVVLCATDVFGGPPTVVRASAGALAVLHTARLASWWRRGVAGHALLWSMFLAYGWMVAGFVLQAAGVTPWALPLHAHVVGGLGTITLSMMARVSLGHTGRDVRQPHRLVGVMAGLVSVAAVARVLGPWGWPAASLSAWTTAGVAWSVAFAALAAWGWRLWTLPRVDGAPG